MGGECLLCDLQGGSYGDKYILTDPAILSNSEEGGIYGKTDLGLNGQHTFFSQHICGDLCKRDKSGKLRSWAELPKFDRDRFLPVQMGTSCSESRCALIRFDTTRPTID